MKKDCPICGKEVTWEGNKWRPFCSERCKLIDLGEWATEKYGVPGEEAEDGGEETTDKKPEDD